MLHAAILGAGGMGRLHAKNLSSIDSVSLKAVCDVQESAAAELAESYNARAYTDFEEMLHTEKPDVLFVCLPPFAHHGEVEKAARAGVHIFLEKPLALTEEAACQMVQAVKESGVITQVGYHYRFGGAVRRLCSLIESGEAGRPVLFNARYECNSLHSPWWRKKEQCGSQLLEQAIHLYDMAIYLMGTPVSAMGYMANLCHTHVPDYTIEDVSAAVMRFQSGAFGTITATNCAVPERWENPFTVVFEKVTAHFTDPNHAVFHDTGKEKTEETVVSCDVDMYREEVKAFMESVQAKEPSSCPIEEGLKSLQIVARLAESNGKEVL